VRQRPLRTLVRAQNGATAVEFALVAPVFLTLLFGIIEFGHALWAQQALQQTAISGARCMALPQSACASAGTYSPTDTATYIQQVASQWGLSLSSGDIIQNNSCGGSSGFSQVSLTMTVIGIPLTATACFPNNP
jgi:Flp pilus assembly protein TadG